MRLSGRTVSKSETTVRRNLVTVNGYFGKKFATDIPSGCSARVNGVQVYPKQREIVLRVRAKLTLLRPEIVRVVRRSLSPEAEQWAEEFLRKDEIKISCRPGKGGRAEVFEKAGKEIWQNSMITFSFEDVEEGQLARGLHTMWAHVFRDACPLDETGHVLPEKR